MCRPRVFLLQVVLEHFRKLRIRVLCRSRNKNVRPNLRMNLQNLSQQINNSRNVLFVRSSYCHFLLHFEFVQILNFLVAFCSLHLLRSCIRKTQPHIFNFFIISKVSTFIRNVRILCNEKHGFYLCFSSEFCNSNLYVSSRNYIFCNVITKATGLFL